MLFHVEMDVAIPLSMPTEQADQIKLAEKNRFQELQQSGTWRHIWRVVGHYSNVSIFDVGGTEELHAILISLPLFPYMTIRIKPLCRHPSSIHQDDR